MNDEKFTGGTSLITYLLNQSSSVVMKTISISYITEYNDYSMLTTIFCYEGCELRR